jgi:hypothetical protein
MMRSLPTAVAPKPLAFFYMNRLYERTSSDSTQKSCGGRFFLCFDLAMRKLGEVYMFRLKNEGKLPSQ